jgi:hypothetical protein
MKIAIISNLPYRIGTHSFSLFFKLSALFERGFLLRAILIKGKNKLMRLRNIKFTSFIQQLHTMLDTPLILVLVCSILVLVWFRKGLVMGIGENGLPFYSPSRWLKVYGHACAEQRGDKVHL